MCMRKGHERYRPTFLACATANKVIGGDLVETIHRGADPRFEATGVFSRSAGVETLEDLPVIWSYGFRDGTRRGLILVSLDTSKERTVAVAFQGRAVGGKASSWLVAAERITGSNEYEEGEPRVNVSEETISGFQSGRRVTLPPHSMRAMSWQVE